MKPKFLPHHRSYSQQSFPKALEAILELTTHSDTLSIGQIMPLLAGRGYAAFFILFSFPFCLPINLPGASTPFGLLLAFLGLRLAFAKRLWWPDWILRQTFASSKIATIVRHTLTMLGRLQPYIHPRLTWLANNRVPQIFHGITICLLALFLALPLPIPLTNMFTAGPIFCIGLGLLEDDGFFILGGYIFAILSWLGFLALVLWGSSWLL